MSNERPERRKPMNVKMILAAPLALLVGAGHAVAIAAPLFPRHATFTTLSITPFAIEGLTGDDDRNLYTTGRAPSPTPCPVWRIDSTGIPPVTPVQIGSIPNTPGACNPSGITF